MTYQMPAWIAGNLDSPEWDGGIDRYCIGAAEARALANANAMGTLPRFIMGGAA